MTALLNQAFAEASQLRTGEQDLLAAWVLELLHSDQRWDVLFAQSQDELAKLANEARSEHRQGKTRLLHIETL